MWGSKSALISKQKNSRPVNFDNLWVAITSKMSTVLNGSAMRSPMTVGLLFTPSL
ncbi:hypothetical protein LCO01nite_11430 [Lapidilactobacillus concavus]|nr:hypothetical protein LCO01nite_11430 [Lapidilactobacillus concavus]